MGALAQAHETLHLHNPSAVQRGERKRITAEGAGGRTIIEHKHQEPYKNPGSFNKIWRHQPSINSGETAPAVFGVKLKEKTKKFVKTGGSGRFR